MQDNNKILFVEPEITGHHLEYIDHLCRFLYSTKLEQQIIFLVHPSFHKVIKLVGKNKCFKKYKNKGIQFVPITQQEYEYYSHRKEMIAALFKNILLLRYIKRYKPAQVLFLMGDHLQFLLDFLFVFKRVKISGIIFRISIHYHSFFGDTISLKERFKNIRKWLLYQKMLLSPVIGTLFTLDPFVLNYARKRFIKGQKFAAIPDPSLYPELDKQYKSHTIHLKIPKDRTMFLLFGTISERKGIFVLLDALLKLSNNDQIKTAVLLAGAVDKNIKENIKEKIQYISEYTNVWIQLIDDFIYEYDLAKYIEMSDVILLPYQRFVGSSGALLWAAGVGKPVITQNFGLVGKWARTLKLGLDVDTTNSNSLKMAMAKMIDKEIHFLNKGNVKTFLKNKTPENFAKLIIDNI